MLLLLPIIVFPYALQCAYYALFIYFFMYSTLMQSKKQSIRVRPNSQTANVEAAHNKKGQVTT